ncbi:hypothetical protein RJ53_00320 [Methanocalculus chunghsingensis]|uniref:Uncharacterized protein n=2 Tax=Methanocalculus chunghsingensis TaxID=156457 RepID=A0A8J7W8C7_9EURY|nr:hypothetical protein [Methanocalculus chunghsingensis]
MLRRPNRSDRRHADDALSEVIGFILILALITIFLSIWMTYVIPAEGRQQEIEHMNYVRDWFTQYKVTADSLWINHGEDKALTGMTFSNSLVLGSQGGATQAGGLFMPLMRPIGSTGGIAVRNYDADGGQERIEIHVDGESINFSLGRLEYETANNYWVSQTYYYQMGGVFLKQPNIGTVSRVAPLINFKKDAGLIDIYITVIQVVEGGRAGISGQGPVRIDTELDSVIEYEPLSNSDVRIEFYLTDLKDAEGWWKTLREERIQAGLTESECPITLDQSIKIVSIDPQLTTGIHYRTVRYNVSLQSVATGAE